MIVINATGQASMRIINAMLNRYSKQKSKGDRSSCPYLINMLCKIYTSSSSSSRHVMGIAPFRSIITSSLTHKSLPHGIPKQGFVAKVILGIGHIDALPAACRSYMGAVMLFRCISQQTWFSPEKMGRGMNDERGRRGREGKKTTVLTSGRT